MQACQFSMVRQFGGGSGTISETMLLPSCTALFPPQSWTIHPEGLDSSFQTPSTVAGLQQGVSMQIRLAGRTSPDSSVRRLLVGRTNPDSSAGSLQTYPEQPSAGAYRIINSLFSSRIDRCHGPCYTQRPAVTYYLFQDNEARGPYTLGQLRAMWNASPNAQEYLFVRARSRNLI